jgi:DNA invertase Pin-like site-specific DNA recombinase
MVRVALYARVSTVDGKQDAQNQLRELRQFVTRKKSERWKVVGEYVDQASGKNGDRPKFKQLFQDASERKFDLVLFWSLDRFSREGVLETMQHLQRLQANGVDWWILKEEYIRSIGPFAEAVLAILACIAKQERVRIQERVRAGLDRARADGKQLGRPRRVVNREKIAELHDAGLSLRRIAAKLQVSSMTVQRILSGSVSAKK